MTAIEDGDEPLPAPKPRRGKGRKRSLAGRLVRTPVMQKAAGLGVRGAFALLRGLGPRGSGAIASFTARRIGPFIGESRLALRNLAFAFPEKSEQERKAILDGVWDNLARTGAEYAYLQQAFEGGRAGFARRFNASWTGEEHFDALREDGRPGIIFTAHLANWELLAVASAVGGLPLVALYRAPTNPYINDALMGWRAGLGRFIPSRPGAMVEVAAALERGEHLGMLVDQALTNGPRVPFFGRPAPTNPIVARLARQFDCPVHGARAIRLPDGGFTLEMTPALDLPRDAEGKIDVVPATAMITGVVEGWVREHPEQWLWLHNRWR